MFRSNAGGVSGAGTPGGGLTAGPAGRTAVTGAAGAARGRKMSRTGAAAGRRPKTSRSLRTSGLSGAGGFWAAASAKAPAQRARAARILARSIAIVPRQCQLGAQALPARSRLRELELLDDQELGEVLDDGQEPLQPGVGPRVGEGDDRLADLLLLHVGIAVVEIGDERPGLGEDLLQVLAQGLDVGPGLVEIARPQLGQVPARVLPALPFGLGLVAGLDGPLLGFVDPERLGPLLAQPDPEAREHDQADGQGDGGGQSDPDERPALLVVQKVIEDVHRWLRSPIKAGRRRSAARRRP